MAHPGRFNVGLASALCLGLALGACTLPAPSPTTAPGTPLFPPPTAGGQGTAVLGGRVWNDVCEPSAEIPSPPNCIVIDAAGTLQANGIMEGGEAGIGGVEVALAAGACPGAPVGSAFTTGDGAYQFAGLAAGDYCVTVAPLVNPDGTPILGVWSLPPVDGPGASASRAITLGEGEIRVDANFGFDYQPPATPTPLAPTETPTPSATPATSTPSVTPSPTAGADDPRARLGQPAWRDAFDSGANWPVYEDTHVRFKVEGGQLLMTALNADHWDAWVLTWPEVTDFYLEMTTTSADCGGQDRHGLMFRSHNTAQGFVGYLFAVTCDGRYSLRSWDGESYTALLNWTASDRINQGASATNRIGVWAEGNRLQLYVNGFRLTEVTDSTHSAGMFGVFVGAVRTPGYTVRADEIAYWTLP